MLFSNAGCVTKQAPLVDLDYAGSESMVSQPPVPQGVLRNIYRLLRRKSHFIQMQMYPSGRSALPLKAFATILGKVLIQVVTLKREPICVNETA